MFFFLYHLDRVNNSKTRDTIRYKYIIHDGEMSKPWYEELVFLGTPKRFEKVSRETSINGESDGV